MENPDRYNGLREYRKGPSVINTSVSFLCPEVVRFFMKLLNETADKDTAKPMSTDPVQSWTAAGSRSTGMNRSKTIPAAIAAANTKGGAMTARVWPAVVVGR